MITRDTWWFDKAKEASTRSTHDRVAIGCVLVSGNNLISRGYNQAKSHPMQARYNERHRKFLKCHHHIHAEIHALVNSSRSSVVGADAYIYREDKEGSLANCRPCGSCYSALREAGISRIYYTSKDGYHMEELD